MSAVNSYVNKSLREIWWSTNYPLDPIWNFTYGNFVYKVLVFLSKEKSKYLAPRFKHLSIVLYNLRAFLNKIK